MKRIGLAMVATAGMLALSPFWGSASSRTSDRVQASSLVAADHKLPGARERLRHVLEACVVERKGARAASKCAGLIAEPCLKLVAGAGGQQAADCYRWETAGWSNLHEDYRARLARRFQSDLSKSLRLRESEEEWATGRVRRCDKAASQIGKPSEPAASICEMKESSQRALYLRLLANEAGAL